jgi:small subunit ribosomal protein S6
LKRYEGMFLFDTSVMRDWAGIEEEVRRLLGRIGAELLACVKFDERKLAFEIKRRKRGTYVLTYFDAPAEKLVDLERDVQLSETVLRAMFLRAEGLTEERLAALRAHPAEQPLAPLAGDGRRHDDDRPRGERGDRGDRGDRGYRGDRGDRGDRRHSGAPDEDAGIETVDATADQGESD